MVVLVRHQTPFSPSGSGTVVFNTPGPRYFTSGPVSETSTFQFRLKAQVSAAQAYKAPVTVKYGDFEAEYSVPGQNTKYSNVPLGVISNRSQSKCSFPTNFMILQTQDL